MIRAYCDEIKPRIYSRKKNKIRGVYSWDIDNLYPQHIEHLINESSTSKSCVTMFKKFLKGNGFSQGETFVNDSQTLNQVLDLSVRDYSKFKGFALYIGYDLLGRIANIKHIPFKYVRFNDEKTKIIVYDNWDKSQSNRIDKDDFLYFDFYEPEKALESQQNGSMGQVLYYSNDGTKTYPLSSIDPVIEDAVSDYETKIFKLKNLQNSFMLKGIFVYPEQESDDEAWETQDGAVQKELKKFQGSEGSQTMSLAYSGDMENVPAKYIPVQSKQNDKAFEYTESSVRGSIIRNFNQPKTLHSEQEGGLFGRDQYIEAYEVYNNITHDDRMNINGQYNLLFPLMGLQPDEIEVLTFRSYDTVNRRSERI